MPINLKTLKPHKLSRDLSGYITYIYGAGGCGKAQPVDTIIPTPDGKRRLGDIKVGDYVLDRHGEPTRVLDVFPQGVIPTYEVIFEDGRSTLCNDQHIFTVYTSRGNFKDVTVREMLDHGVLDKGNNSYYNIPMNEPIDYNKKDFSVDPYVVGCFLGSGCCKERQLTISSSDEELVALVAKLINSAGYVKNPADNYSWIFKQPEGSPIRTYNNLPVTKIQTKELFSKYLNEICVSAQEKEIPEEYLLGSIEQRWELLRGLLDTDGSIDNIKGRIKFTTVSKKLAHGIVELVNSLGYRGKITLDKRTEKNTNGVCYNVDILAPNEDKYKFFNLSRKKEIAIKFANVSQHRKYNILRIKEIKDLGYNCEMVCIYVDNKEHLYLTNDYIVTHNTTFGVQAPKPLLLASTR